MALYIGSRTSNIADVHNIDDSGVRVQLRRRSVPVRQTAALPRRGPCNG